MKYSTLTLVACMLSLLFSATSIAQANTVTTQSVTIESLIPFVVKHYGSASGKHNITLLIETKSHNFSSEERILLKQALKYFSEQLTEEDTISIIAYNTLNGIVLDQTSAKNLKKMLNVLNDFGSHITTKINDGITLAYTHANETLKTNVKNTVLMIRNPNGSKSITVNNEAQANALTASQTKKQKSNMVLLTAIAVLPELISIIKN